ncbi:MAG TPA: hypothetical protein VGM39_03995 [Kofleriaceae bacterium]|jgi:hypothetical protein
MRFSIPVLLAAGVWTGCTAPAGNVLPDLDPASDAIYHENIQSGDVLVLIPGTGSYDYLATEVMPLPEAEPVLDVHQNLMLYNDSIVFEQAIAAAHRAGVDDSEIEDGSITFALWGTGITKKRFTYVSLEGLHVPIEILSEYAQSCAHGSVSDNLFGYTGDHAKLDATTLWTDLQTFLPAHPAKGATEGRPRHVVLDAHSWGGAIAEYATYERDAIVADKGALPDGAVANLTISMGVPGLVLGYTFKGPGLRDMGDLVLYEIDRPDDPVHTLDPSGNGAGHQYDIIWGDEYKGSYGITTDELSCLKVPGPCGPRND